MEFTIDKGINSAQEDLSDNSDLGKEEKMLLGHEQNKWDAFINVITYPKHNTSHYN